MAYFHTCVCVGNKIQYTGINGKFGLRTGDIGIISGINSWTDEKEGGTKFWLEFENTQFGITINDISPNSTDFRLYHSDEDLKMIKDHLHHFGIDYYKN